MKKKIKKEFKKIYEDLKEDNEHLIFDFDGIKMVNEILIKDNNIFKQKIEELEKELEKSEEYINIDSKIKNINELNILKDMHEEEIKNLKDKINDKDKSINELKDMHEQEIILKKKSDQEPDQQCKSRKRADQEPDQKGNGYVNLPIVLTKKYTNNNSKELINNIKQLINGLYDSEQITKQVYNNLIKAITYK